MFETAMVGASSGRGALSFSGSLLLQSGVLGGLLVAGILLPIAQPDVPDLRISPPAPKFREAMKIISTSIERSASALVRPQTSVFRLPSNVRPALKDSQNSMDALISGLPLGTSGSGGLLDGIIDSIDLPRLTAPPAAVTNEVAKPATAARIQVGGNVLASRLLRRVDPLYPELARRARIEGVVRLHGIITREGHIAQLQVLSGHPLLVKAALEAVRQWVYSPTLLNQQAVEVEAPIEVRFTLSR